MSKSIELTSSQVKALEDGASMLIVLINNIRSMMLSDDYIAKFIEVYSPLQKGDKDIFVKEEFFETETAIWYKEDCEKNNVDTMHYESKMPYKMTKEQSRLTIKEVLDVRVKRVKDLTTEEIFSLGCYRKEVPSWGSRGGEYPPIPTQDFAYTFDGKFGYTSVQDCFGNWLNNYTKELEEKHYQETNEKIEMLEYEDNPHLFLYEIKMEDR